MSKHIILNLCPVCGYDDLPEPPYGADGDDWGSFEICYSCGFQFGVTDRDKHISHDQWRQQWIDGGMIWDSIGRKMPEGWDPREQLKKIGVKV